MHILDLHFRWRAINNAKLQYFFVWELSAPVMAMWFNSIGSFVELLICPTFFLGSACEKYEAWKVPLSFSLSLLGQNGFHYVRNHGNQLSRVTSLQFKSTLHDQEYTGKENFDQNLKWETTLMASQRVKLVTTERYPTELRFSLGRLMCIGHVWLVCFFVRLFVCIASIKGSFVKQLLFYFSSLVIMIYPWRRLLMKMEQLNAGQWCKCKFNVDIHRNVLNNEHFCQRISLQWTLRP